MLQKKNMDSMLSQKLSNKMNNASDLTNLTLSQAKQMLEKKEISSKELVEDHLKAIDRHKDLNAFIEVTAERALDRAEKSDQKIAKGEGKKLEGLPLAIKDLFCTKGVASTACSKILKDYKPVYESTVTQNLWDNGAVMLGKTNMDEFAMGSSNLTSHYGGCKSPWKRLDSQGNIDQSNIVPGGSSGGSASAVAADCALAATGSDTGGSIRQPAAFCGIVGLKPTYGRCSRWGMIAFASSLDQAGPMTKSVEDAALFLEAMAGYDPKDSTSINLSVPEYSKNINSDLKGKKIGIPKEYRLDEVPDEINKVWDQGIEWLKERGAEIIDVDLPHTKYALPAYYIIAPAEASSNLARYDGVKYGYRNSPAGLDEMYCKTRYEGFGDEVKRRILIGTYVLSAGYYDAYYIKAQKIRRLILNDFKEAYEKVDAIVTPTTPSEAFAFGENQDDPIKMYLNDVFTVPASLAGVPALSLPVTLSKNGLPLGLQVIGNTLDEQMVVNVGKAIEECAGYNAKPF